MGNVFFFQWEVDLIVWLQTNLGTAGAVAANFFSMMGEEIIAILLLGTFYWGISKKIGLSIGLHVSLAGVWGSSIKNIAKRRRPYFDNPSIHCLRPLEPGADLYSVAQQGYSLPSGHSSNAAATYGTIAANAKKKWIKAVCILIAFLVGVSRFCVGVHYPTDVLCGWLMAVLAMVAVSMLEKKVKSKGMRALLMMATAIPGVFFCKTNDFFTFFGVLAGILAGNLFEERFVNFHETRNITAVILRVLGGLALYPVLDGLLKLPFSADFLASGTFASMMVRAARYFIILFGAVGVYPMLFEKVPLMKG